MIRRETPDSYELITQNDHAILAGQLAAELGNDRFSAMSRGQASVLGVALHDCGWPLHDDAPTINARKQPVDVFESVPDVAMKVWLASADRAAEQDPYAGLLVSLHVLALSAFAADAITRQGRADLHWRFESNKFQHREIERQEQLRKTLGLRTDQPTTYGLVEEGLDPEEDSLRFDLRMLQAMDQISLNVCCNKVPFPPPSVHSRPGEPLTKLRLTCSGDWAVRVDPWPFHVARVETEVPYRRLAKIVYESDEQLREAYARAPIAAAKVLVHPD